MSEPTSSNSAGFVQPPDFGTGSLAGDFLRGFALPFQAVRWVTRSPRLRRFTLASAALTAAVLVLLVGVLAGTTDDLLGLVWERPDATLARVAWYLVAALCFAVLFVIGANALPLLLLAPLQDPISEATEALCDGPSQSPHSALAGSPWAAGTFWKSLVVSVWHTAARLALFVSGHVALFALHLIPAVGSVLWVVLSTVWTLWWLAAEYLSIPMARHLYPFSEVRRLLRERVGLTLGFGGAVYLLLWVPVLNTLFVPLAIVAGTLLFRGLQGRLKRPGTESSARDS